MLKFLCRRVLLVLILGTLVVISARAPAVGQTVSDQSDAKWWIDWERNVKKDQSDIQNTLDLLPEEDFLGGGVPSFHSSLQGSETKRFTEDDMNRAYAKGASDAFNKSADEKDRLTTDKRRKAELIKDLCQRLKMMPELQSLSFTTYYALD